MKRTSEFAALSRQLWEDRRPPPNPPPTNPPFCENPRALRASLGNVGHLWCLGSQETGISGQATRRSNRKNRKVGISSPQSHLWYPSSASYWQNPRGCQPAR